MTTPTTTSAALRAAQAPIKESYKTTPASALVTLKSSGTLDSQSITCRLDGPNASAIRDAHSKADASKAAASGTKVAGLHPAAGGPDPELSGELCSGDMLLEALVACSGVTLKAVATALEIPIESGRVWAEGDLDFRGTLGVDRGAAVGFTAIRLGFEIELAKGAEVEEGRIEKLAKLTERYCVVLQTIAKKPELSVSVKSNVEGEDGIGRGVSWGQKM